MAHTRSRWRRRSKRRSSWWYYVDSGCNSALLLLLLLCLHFLLLESTTDKHLYDFLFVHPRDGDWRGRTQKKKKNPRKRHKSVALDSPSRLVTGLQNEERERKKWQISSFLLLLLPFISFPLSVECAYPPLAKKKKKEEKIFLFLFFPYGSRLYAHPILWLSDCLYTYISPV